MDTLNSLLTHGSGYLFAPFRHVPTVGLLFWSLVTGVIMTYVFAKTSNQGALRRAADNIRAQLFAVKIFKDDLVVTFQCQKQLLKSTALRLWYSIPPMLVMIVPLVFVLTQLAMRYEFRPLVRGEGAVVSMRIRPDAWKEHRDVLLELGDGIVAETESLRDDKNTTLYWRVRVQGEESNLLRWVIGDESLSKALPISASSNTLIIANPKRAGGSLSEQILYPAEPELPVGSPVQSIDIQLVPRKTPILGLDVPWWLTFFLVSMLVALITGKLTGVQY